MQLSDYIDYLKANVIDVKNKNEFDRNGIFFRIEKFYDSSNIDELMEVNADYNGRLPKNTFMIANAGNGGIM